MTESDGSKQPATPSPAIVWQRRVRTMAAHALGALGRTLISVGALLLLFVGYQLWGTGLHEARAQHSLSNEFEELLRSTTTTSSTTTLAPTTSVETTEPAPTTTLEVQPDEVLAAFSSGDAVARIRGPKIDLDKIVVEGVEVDDLRKGPGHYRSTPMPGQRGNAAIAGHRTTYGAPFNRIDELEPGDEILVSTPQGDFTYKVIPQTDSNGAISGHLIVSPNDVWVLDDAGDNRLTLTACHPKYSASQRIIVQATLVVPPALTPKLVSKPAPVDDASGASVDTVQAKTLPDETVPVREDLDAGLGGDGGHRWPTFFWALMVAIFLIGIGRSTKHWGRAELGDLRTSADARGVRVLRASGSHAPRPLAKYRRHSGEGDGEQRTGRFAGVRHRLGILALVVVVAACQRDSAEPAVDGEAPLATSSVSASSTAPTTANASGTTVKSTPGIEGLPVDQDTLVVGDCFNRYAGLQNFQTIEIVTKRPCPQPHDGEVFYKSDYAGSVTVNTYPGKEKLTTDSIRACYDNFQAFVGKAYETSTYQLGYFVPQQDRWESTTARYRAVTCYVTAYTRGTKLTGTVRDSRL